MSPRIVAFLGLFPSLIVARLPALAAQAEGAYLGVRLGDIPEVLQAHLGAAAGAMVVDVVAGSPAEKAGLRRHDVILKVAEREVKSPADVVEEIRERQAGEEVALTVQRAGKPVEVRAALASAAEAPEGAKEPPAPAPEPGPGFLGVGSEEVPEVLAVHLELAAGMGVLVRDVWKESPAEKAGIEARDVVVAVDGYEVKGPADFIARLGERKAGDEVGLELIHKGARRTVKVVLGPRPENLPEGGFAPHLQGEWHPVPFPPHGGRYAPGAPGAPGGQWRFRALPPNTPWHGRYLRGKWIFRGPGGEEHEIPLPEDFWAGRWESLQEDLEKELGKDLEKLHGSDMLRDLQRRLQDIVRGLDVDVDVRIHGPGGPKGGPVGASGRVSSVSRSQFTLQRVEGDLEITVTGTNGLKTVTVRRGGKTIAQDLPWEERGSLPEDVRGKAEELLRSRPELDGPGGERVKDGAPPPLPEDDGDSGGSGVRA